MTALLAYLLACHLVAFGVSPRRRGPAEIVSLAEYRAERLRKARRAERALARMRTAPRSKRPLAGLQ